MRRRLAKPLLVLAVLVALTVATTAVDRLEGGYVGCKGEGHDTVVYNFLKHFGWDNHYYWAVNEVFSTWNDAYVDKVDFAFFAGHGNPWKVYTTNGSQSLTTAGSDPIDRGWGDVNCEFIAFESCYVVPSPLEKSNWWSNWISESDDVFDGLHQALGFRTHSWQSTDQKVSDYFGDRIARGYAVWQAWFDAINRKAKSDEMGSAVMHPSADGDTYGSFVTDPPADHGSLRVWYQY